MNELLLYILFATLSTSTTYGWGEMYCGNPGNPKPCVKGAITASGEELDPSRAMAAIAIPTRCTIKARWIWLRVGKRPCVKVRLADKMNSRWIGQRGFDLTPAAVYLLTGKPASRHWSGRVSVCWSKGDRENLKNFFMGESNGITSDSINRDG